MNPTKIIKQILLEKDMTVKELADLLNIQYSSARNKLSRGTYTLAEFVKIIELLDCEILIRTKEGTIYK